MGPQVVKFKFGLWVEQILMVKKIIILPNCCGRWVWSDLPETDPHGRFLNPRSAYTKFCLAMVYIKNNIKNLI